MASTDPVAIDRAAYDLIEKENTEGSREWINNSKSKMGTNTLKVAEYLGIGTQDYNLIDVDKPTMIDEIRNNPLWNLYIPSSIMILIGISILGIAVFSKKHWN